MLKDYLGEKEVMYHPVRGARIPRCMYEVLNSRAFEPLKLYAFLDGLDFPCVTVFDKFGKGSYGYPKRKKTVEIILGSRRNIILPKRFEKKLQLEDRITFVGLASRFELWNPQEWGRFNKECDIWYDAVAEVILG